MKKTIIALLTTILLAPSGFAQEQDIHEMFREMMKTVEGIETLSFKLDKSERVKGEMVPGSQSVKLNMKPFKTYLKVHVPNEGAEVLYKADWNDGNAKVNPNAFPYMTLNLDPDGSILRKGQHHSVKQLGFDYTADVFDHVYKLYKDKIGEYVKVNGEVTFDGKKCLNVVLDNKDYKMETYTVQEGEDLLKIARKLRLNEYQLLELNGLRNFDSVKAGQQIKVPTTYCKKIEMYVDKDTYLPVYQKMFDEKGLSAVYEYSKLKINPSFKAAEFTEDYSEYDF